MLHWIWLAAISMTATLAATGHPQANNTSYIIHGAGNGSCGRWLEARKAEREISYVAWIQGYLTASERSLAVDRFKKRTSATMRETDADGIRAFADKTCSEQPLIQIHDVAQLLADQLKAAR
jgi:hypothetical protein